MALNPKYVGAPRIGAVRISTPNTSRTGSGTLGTVITGGVEGTKLDDVVIQAAGTTTAGMVRLFLVGTIAPTFAALFAEIQIKAVTPSASVAAFSTSLKTAPGNLGGSAVLPFTLPPGVSLRASTEKGEIFDVIAFAGDF
jgi:hypothetical protein